jgi:hypothetical protein
VTSGQITEEKHYAINTFYGKNIGHFVLMFEK